MTRSEKRPSILSGPGAPTLLGSSIFARLPLAMFSIALLVHAQHLTGSFAVAGLVSGAYAISGAVSAPLLGRMGAAVAGALTQRIVAVHPATA